MNLFEILLRFVIVFIFSLVFGLERQRAHKPIGFGTYSFVSMGACGLAIVATTLNVENPIPLLSAIVTGIGFLGAGALIKTADKIFGFTSAASIWLFSIMGLTIGIGQYMIGFILYSSTWIVLIVDKYLENKGIGTYQRKIIIVSDKNPQAEDLISVLKTKKFKIMIMEVNKKTSEVTLNLTVESSKSNMNLIPKRLSKTEWVKSFKID